MSKLAKEMSVEYISVYEIMCHAKECLTLVNDNEENQVVTSYDGGHLTPDASIWLIQKIHDNLLKGSSYKNNQQ